MSTFQTKLLSDGILFLHKYFYLNKEYIMKVCLAGIYLGRQKSQTIDVI